MSLEEFDNYKDMDSSASRPTRLHAFLHLLLGILFSAGSIILLGALASVVCFYFINGEISNIDKLPSLMADLQSRPFLLKLFAVLGSSLPLIVAVLLVFKVAKANAVDFLTLNKPQNLKWVVVGLVLVFLSVPLLGFWLEVNQLIDFSQFPKLHKWLLAQEANNHTMYESMIGDKSFWSITTSLFAMALIPAIAEEIFFRGFLMNVFNGIFKNMHVSIVVTSLLFSIVHVQFMKFLPMFFLAMAFGYAAYWSGTIWTSIIAHFLNNALAVSQLYFITDGDYNKALEEGPTLPLAVNIGILVLLVGVFIYAQRNSETKTNNFYV